ncbi:glycosyltransferase [Demequina sp. NBRC 110057]|uniref:glycosyltransferase n=1 Tax=Demequina sp. NBRC 110057 TaxID=1570346 RepID=UPI0009FEEAB0|nr:glycosyltransferase [Demequina sp. NBRC 110057]
MCALSPSEAHSQEARVVAVVVSYNRRDLLLEALDALAAQTLPLAGVVVVDNASTDGSAEAARGAHAEADVVTLTTNIGGAGGFAAGIQRALTEHRPEWIWLMDDDTIARPDAAQNLVAAATAAGAVVAGSRVVWTDGSDHPMNTPRRRPCDSRERRGAAASVGAMSVRSSSFVSMLVDADAARAEAPPVPDYFIWNDDFEYSTRLLRHRLGIFVPASVVVHKTAKLGSTDVDPGPRFYYEVRNKVWMWRLSTSLSPAEKVVYGASSAVRWARTFARSQQRGVLADGLRRGWRDGWRERPRPADPVLADAGLPGEGWPRD